MFSLLKDFALKPATIPYLVPTRPSAKGSPTKGDQVNLSDEARAPEKGGFDTNAFAEAFQGSRVDLGEKLLRRGSRGEAVRNLQKLLNQQLGTSLETDGILGPRTQAAIRKFQAENRLSRDGIVGPRTREALLGAPKPKGVPEIAKPLPGEESWSTKLPPGLRPYAKDFQDAGNKYGIDPRFLAAISMQETGGGRSYAFRHKNNAMGITGRSGVRRFSSIRQSIMAQAHSLTRPGGYYQGKETIREIGKTYAPVGAKNDPRGLNRHWIPNITTNYAKLGGNPKVSVRF